MGTSPSRADLVSKTATTVGPGEYEHSKQFGQETKSFTIGEKREFKTVETIGPGAYSPDRADGITKLRSINIDMGKSKTGRDNSIKASEVTVGPGQYDDGKQFG